VFEQAAKIGAWSLRIKTANEPGRLARPGFLLPGAGSRRHAAPAT